MPDGVNSALEYYSPEMTTTRDGYFEIKTHHDEIEFTTWNAFADPPEYQNKTMYYKSAMVQSWNKFCFQGGKIEVRAQLPGVVSPESENPDLKHDKSHRVKSIAFYPTWPGIWLLGNLGRALFLPSTNKVWPWSFDECDEEGISSKNQKFSACDENPGYGLNPFQGLGAPEVDIIEGGGTEISVSIQLAPGMEKNFRIVLAENSYDPWTYLYCVYGHNCKTPGANTPNLPTDFYASIRPGYRTWYQGIRYSPNSHCAPEEDLKQSYETVKASLDKGISENTCRKDICPGSRDVSSDLGLKDGGPVHWGINHDGSCMPYMNGYTGAFLCNPGNEDLRCLQPGEEELIQSKVPISENDTFAYQMDAISANYPIHLAAYTDFIKYQVEWVTGPEGYIRYMVDDVAVYELPAQVLENVPEHPQGQPHNPTKIMVEEPMYIIFNVALSTKWGTRPPNAYADEPMCYGADNSDVDNRVCDGFPLYLKIDYIRLWQREDMSIGCDPASHPTREYINAHLEQYTDPENPWIPVVGGANCKVDEDCTVDTISGIALKTGECRHEKCHCFHPQRFDGPRCTSIAVNDRQFSPPFSLVAILVGTTFALTAASIYYRRFYAKSDGSAKYQKDSNSKFENKMK